MTEQIRRQYRNRRHARSLWRLEQASGGDDPAARWAHDQARDRRSRRSGVRVAVPSDPQDGGHGAAVARAGALRRQTAAARLEAVAGVIEDNDAATCVHREAMEEALLKLDSLEHVFTAWTMPGLSTELMHFFLAVYSGGRGRKSAAASTRTKTPSPSRSVLPTWRAWPTITRCRTPRRWCCCRHCGCAGPILF